MLSSSWGGAPAADDVRTWQLLPTLHWAAAMAGFENAGLKLRYFRSEDWRGYPDLSLSVLQKTADADPRMVEAIVRGAAKATVFALENPDCVRQIQWRRWPGTKPTGADEATLARWDLNLLQAQLDTLRDGYKLNGGRVWGNVDFAGYDRMQDFMLESKQIERKLPAVTYGINVPGLHERAGTFDEAAVRAQARRCELP